MPAFANPNKTAEYRFTDPDGGDNLVVYRTRQSLRVEAAVERELLEMRINAGDVASDGEAANMRIHFGMNAQKMAVLKYNIVKWDGPWFYKYDEEGQLILDKNGEAVVRPFSPAAVDELDGVDNAFWVDELYQLISDSNQKTTSHPKGKKSVGKKEMPS